ncbi:VENN motif pre-toxin domain-containing protein [Erwinia persicina]|uniref:VENN motif pre-toxin domain-containing protein n=1 Tax=Erwinia persicina TaxID=55211 RepID=UPI0013C2B3F6|nr:VENN motif pre-toxin domain-containing protein [Erwinia persicina]
MIRLSGYVKISKIPTIWPGFYCSLSQLRLSRPLLGPCDHLNKLGDLLLFTGGELFTGLTQGGDNFRLLWLELAAGLAGGLSTGDTGGAVTAGQAGKNAVENNLLGGNEESQTKFVQEHGKDVASCTDNPTGAACQRGQAMNEALMVALPAGLGGGVLAAATPEIAAILKAGIESCSGALALCINNLGLQASEIIVPGGVGAGGLLG